MCCQIILFAQSVFFFLSTSICCCNNRKVSCMACIWLSTCCCLASSAYNPCCSRVTCCSSCFYAWSFSWRSGTWCVICCKCCRSVCSCWFAFVRSIIEEDSVSILLFSLCRLALYCASSCCHLRCAACHCARSLLCNVIRRSISFCCWHSCVRHCL